MSATDSAAVLLETARQFEARERWDVAEPLYRLILERYGATPAAETARARLDAPPDAAVYGSGRVEAQVWMSLYGAWLGVAVPGALGADQPEAYGAGLLLGGPAGFLAGRMLANGLDLTEGQARAITLGGTWGTWQGWGWREVFGIGTREICDPDPFGSGEFCYETEDVSEEQFAAMVLGGLAGIGAGALLSHRVITPGTGTAANFAALWGSWFGFAGGYLAGLEDDALLASTLVTGNAGLLGAALLAPRWNVTRNRARLVSIAGVLGGLAGGGLDLILQPDDAKVAVAIPLAGSLLGLGIGIGATREDGGTRVGSPDGGPDGAILTLRDGRLGLGTPLPTPTLLPRDAPDGTRWEPALRVEVFRATF
ncbi:MAG TPA: hypothetical protein VMM35_03430 [Longimicrobiales bacterium]|nr:hypothetical protein [Longimicrobiales bacterium]